MDVENKEEVEMTSPEAEPLTDGDVNDKKPSPTFESAILDTVGHFGPFQRWVFALLTMTDIPAGMAMLYFIFSNANPGTKCNVYEGNKTWSNNFTIGNEIACQMNVTGPRCIEYEYEDKYQSIVTEWDLVCMNTYIPKLTITIQFIGLTIGAATAGQLADTYGRKKCTVTFLALMLVTQTLVGVANSWELFAIIRGSVGFFAGGTIGINFVTPMEFIGPKWRPLCGCLGAYEVGHVFLCLFAYLVKDWRHLSFITGSATLPLLFAIAFFVPESPRWLIQKGRFKEASAIIERMARFNKKPVPDLSVLKQLQNINKEEQEEISNYNYLDLFSTKTFALRSCVVLFVWFSASEIYYGVIIQISSFMGDIYINAVMSSLLTIPGNWSAIPVARYIGRKKGLLIYGGIAVLCMFAIVILNATGHVAKDPLIVTGLALVGKCAIVGLWSIMSIYTSELYPTVMRNIGVGAGNASARVGGMLAPQFALLGLYFHWTIPYIIHGVLAIICAILELVILPETNNIPLPENPPIKKRKPKDDDAFQFGSAPLWPIPLGSALSLEHMRYEEDEHRHKRKHDSHVTSI